MCLGESDFSPFLDTGSLGHFFPLLLTATYSCVLETVKGHCRGAKSSVVRTPVASIETQLGLALVAFVPQEKEILPLTLE